MLDNTLNSRLNQAINESPIQEDRILWEIANQQVFFTKDKSFISNAIKSFLEINKNFCDDIGEHIFERFSEIAEDISNIDENEYPYFIFKNTSCDDNVESWFSKYDDETEDSTPCSLKEQTERVTEFVIIENNIIINFISNVDYFNQEHI